MTVQVGNQEWTFDSAKEFLAKYRVHACKNSAYFGVGSVSHETGSIEPVVSWTTLNEATVVNVAASSRPRIESVFEIFDSAEATSRLPKPPAPEPIKPPTPIIFIGHCRSG